jgi:hypothetical protein
MAVSWLAIVRDGLAIVVVLSFANAILGAFDVGVGAVVALDFLLLVAAFCAIGCANPERRHVRLALTAAGAWALLLLVNLVRGAAPPDLRDLGATLLAALVGGAASLAIVRPGSAPGAASGPEPPPPA